MIQVKRIYEDYSKRDGYRILVDRVWPRGIKKEAAHIDEWMKEVGPSTGLRKWFNHDPEKFAEFRKRYKAELKSKQALLQEIERQAKTQTVTLLYGAKDEEHNQAVVLKEVLEK